MLLISGSITSYLLDIQPGLHVILSETQGANVTRHIHGLRGIHAHKDAANNWEWPLQDGLGSVREVVDNSVAVLESRNYDLFGNGFGNTGTSQTNYGFTGELVDGGGLLDLRARRYAPGLGVFASLDFLESSNRYWYTNGNPINLRDAKGLSPEEDFWSRVRDSIVNNLPWELGNTSYNRPTSGPYNVQFGPDQIRRMIQSASCSVQDQCRQAFDQLISHPKKQLADMLVNTAENINRTSRWGRIWLGLDPTPAGVGRIQAGFEAFSGLGDVIIGGGFANLRSGDPVRMAFGAFQIYGLVEGIAAGFEGYILLRLS